MCTSQHEKKTKKNRNKWRQYSHYTGQSSSSGPRVVGPAGDPTSVAQAFSAYQWTSLVGLVALWVILVDNGVQSSSLAALIGNFAIPCDRLHGTFIDDAWMIDTGATHAIVHGSLIFMILLIVLLVFLLVIL